ncbi:MAG: DoxX family membrane protein [Planctomycetia bacterium]|nr:DoxX family membrane protein [Planctomycetia bacterium]
MVRASGLAALAIFAYGAVTSHYMLGTLESAAAALLVAAYGPRLPCADQVLDVDLLGDSLASLWKAIRGATPVIVRLGLGTTLIWLAVTEKFFNPRMSEAVVIEYGLHTVVPVSTAMWVFAVGVIEVAVGTMLVVGLYTRGFSLIALLVLMLSFFYFKEEVAGHVTFFGSLIVLLFTGAGHWSIDSLVARWTRNARGTAVPYVIA